MAAPPEVTIKNLSGQWVMNKTLSDDTDTVLALQGIGWFTRKAISLATVYLDIKQYTGPPEPVDDGAPIGTDDVTHVDIDQTATGGIKGTTELRTLDWRQRTKEDHIFGRLKGSSRWSNFEGIDDDFFKADWLEEGEEAGGPNGEKHIESYVINDEAGWTARQIWGFAIIEGERYYVRRVVVWKGEEVRRVRLVYNFLKKNDA